MRFEASLKELQKAVKELEKAGKSVKKKQKNVSTNQIDMFGLSAPSTNAANDLDVKSLKKQLDEAISSMETLIKGAA
jgi:exonuclease VII small subunit